MSFEKLLKAAYEEAGVELPSKKIRIRRQRKDGSVNDAQKNDIVNPRESRSEAGGDATRKPDKFDHVRLSVAETAKVVWRPSALLKSEKLLLRLAGDGRLTQLGKGNDAELCIGLDFGTSTLKAAVNDKAIRRSYAVQFRDMPGVDAYLLPCRLYKKGNFYSLEGGRKVFHDLKLSLLESPQSNDCQQKCVAFLALAIRRIRSWLFSEYSAQYPGGIVWGMTAGLPVARMNDQIVSDSYHRLVMAAWLASCDSSDQITCEIVEDALNRATEILSGVASSNLVEDVEIKLVPEIAAQIYGFVSSHAYDPNASNIFLMVDVGAGTVDASVFRVERPKGRRKDNFVIFNSFVEPFGVMNLHRKRMSFCRDLFGEKCPNQTELLDGIDKIAWMTDAEAAIPDSLGMYFSGVKFLDHEVESSIDQELYRNVRNQIGSEAYAKLHRNHILPVSQIKGMPMLLCGGGSRMPLYQQLKTHMASSPGCRWFGVSRFDMIKPRDLVAKNLDRIDVDRLSVAYGLSKVDVGKIVYDVEPLPQYAPVNKYGENYIDK